MWVPSHRTWRFCLGWKDSSVRGNSWKYTEGVRWWTPGVVGFHITTPCPISHKEGASQEGQSDRGSFEFWRRRFKGRTWKNQCQTPSKMALLSKVMKNQSRGWGEAQSKMYCALGLWSHGWLKAMWVAPVSNRTVLVKATHIHPSWYIWKKIIMSIFAGFKDSSYKHQLSSI